MILADTSVWIDHLRGTSSALRFELEQGRIVMHPYVTAELALGSLKDRRKTVAMLEMLPQLQVAMLSEVRRMAEAHKLHGKGIGLVDVHLIASVMITPGTSLWTVDKRLHGVAEAMRVHRTIL
ncbi:PIN domain-containing protein [Granulicella sp. 5B5]|uniref:type II toxin-antitoxin system VapC family toxin n=1 Tax=Granulicella sp. 5B5 TaxID=1617967 RepID=UPI0015F5E461|nr:type II toxin-antitoxin system VapC family toxin [Granulicella sp. 5B5]QMV18252.1 PIN domain-containing protein [Granulicella sp. 5B5]